jgi:dihydromethanopterin reductase (acceptor)
MVEQRIAWAMTGAGHALEDCSEVLLKQEAVDLFLSRAAEEVLGMYALDLRLHSPTMRSYSDTLTSSPWVSRFFTGKYRVLVVAPATSNSVAKFVCGISDTLVTNLFAQAGKSRTPIIVYPTDLAPEMDSLGPHREPLKIYPRLIDLENTEKLRRFAGVHIVCNREELERCIAEYK